MYNDVFKLVVSKFLGLRYTLLSGIGSNSTLSSSNACINLTTKPFPSKA